MDRIIDWLFIIWYLIKVGIISFATITVLYLFCPPFEKWFDKLIKNVI